MSEYKKDPGVAAGVRTQSENRPLPLARAKQATEETMETSRRDILKLGAAVAATGLATTAMADAANAQTTAAQAAPSPAPQVPVDSRLRLVSYATAGSDAPKLGIVPANGRRR